MGSQEKLIVNKLYKIKFKEPYTISNFKGDYSSSEKFILSDTIHAAIVDISIRYGIIENAQQKIEEFARSFVPTNLYPLVLLKCKEGSKELFFLPIPILWKIALIQRVSSKKDQSVSIKNFKKIEFVELELFNQLNSGDSFTLNNISFKENLLISKDVSDCIESGQLNFFESVEVGRNVQSRVFLPKSSDKQNSENVDSDDDGIDRIQPYFVERVFTFDHVYFYFIVSFLNGEDIEKFERALNVLSESGIGSDRAVGNGRFTIEGIYDLKSIPAFKELLENKNNTQWVMNLSLFSPVSSQIKGIKEGFYQLAKRGGWISSPPFSTLRKKSVILIREGSCFKRGIMIANSNGGDIQGRIVDVSPDWNAPVRPIVYRSGLSVFVGINHFNDLNINLN